MAQTEQEQTFAHMKKNKMWVGEDPNKQRLGFISLVRISCKCECDAIFFFFPQLCFRLSQLFEFVKSKFAWHLHSHELWSQALGLIHSRFAPKRNSSVWYNSELTYLEGQIQLHSSAVVCAQRMVCWEYAQCRLNKLRLIHLSCCCLAAACWCLAAACWGLAAAY